LFFKEVLQVGHTWNHTSLIFLSDSQVSSEKCLEFRHTDVLALRLV
jgi:hypothetical protein